MPELFIRCPTCSGSGVDPESQGLPARCGASCKGGLIRYGTEIGHVHVWAITTRPNKVGTHFVDHALDRTAEEHGWRGVVKEEDVFCACGKLAAEVTV